MVKEAHSVHLGGGVIDTTYLPGQTVEPFALKIAC